MPRIKISDLLNQETAIQYQPDLMKYFKSGGTWKDLLEYDVGVMAAQYKVAYDLYTTGDYKNASSVFTYLTVLNPYEFTYWMGLGSSKQAERQLEEAIVAYTMAEAVDEYSPIPHLSLAQCYYALNQKDLAKEHLEKVIVLAKEEPIYQDIKLKALTLLQHLPLR